MDISDKYELHNPYRTDASIATLTRYTAYTAAANAQSDENVTISNGFVIAEVIDRADLAQSGYLSQMDLADAQGVLLNEKIESYIYADFANRTDFGVGDITGGTVADTTQITITDTNVDDICTNLTRVISVAKGDSLLERNGAFIVWSPAGFQHLTTFMMNNGFASADQALRGNVFGGVDYMGFTHYRSNLLTANHLIAGVKKVYHLGILRSTYGQIVVDEKDPGLISGVGVTSRLDLAVKAWTKTKPVIFDVNTTN